ncbi:cytochrome P450 [Penicillium cataractarum]|uniref:Cytochrome P450 n=1 Tax=Penicillium cataractarum TaxID=2100454 RepID=A0A9W9RQR7_9EURO|nr:cytochrome P450 [Penicillium cataractarum]KAJ5363930.1 cytochrome P450 [Penicillium cataractarum]
MERRQLQIGGEATDIMSWLWHWTQENEPGEYNEVEIARSLTSAVFGAIHTTTQVLVHCLFELATRSEYVDPLRHEVQQAFEYHGGWKKDGLESMLKLDSFIKECQRFYPLDSVLFDEKFYPHAHEFDGYQFYRLGQQTGKPQDFRFVATNTKYLQFGDGRHTCPGRYMAADEIRLMLGHILLHYEITTKNNEGRPKNWFFKKILFPDMKGLVVLKPRLRP